MPLLFRLFSRLPLWLLHSLGWAAGWLAFGVSAEYRRRFVENAALAGVNSADRRRAVGESGKLLAELPRLWMGPPVAVRWDGEAHVQAALQQKSGIVFLTPHLGCFEITAQAYAQRFGVHGPAITVLFRPPRKVWLRKLVGASRNRPGMESAPTTLAGVKQLVKALRQGHCVGLLPDQVPPQGMGVWAAFFGKPAYTMTLSARLALQTGATVLLAWGERLPRGEGYVVHVAPLSHELPPDLGAATAQLNRAMEQLVRQKPSQYLWGYARYKTPRSDAL